MHIYTYVCRYKSESVQLDISEFDKLLKVEYLNENKKLKKLIPKGLKNRVNENEIFAVADVQVSIFIYF
jgi:hypothetical protein